MRCFLLVLVLLSFAASGRAQSGSSALIAPEAARRVGLERMWFTQLGLDRGRGRVSGVCLHVSPTKSHTVFRVIDRGQWQAFSQRDRNAFGEEIGVEAARAKAEEKAQAIKKELEIAGQPDAVAPPVETYVVPKITIYASSEQGLVHALDGETGRTLWVSSIGNAAYFTTAPAANDKFVGICNGSTIYVMQADDGAVVWTRPAIGSPGAGPALTDEYIFVPMVNGQVESFLLEDPKRPVSVYKSFGRTMVQPVTSSNSVAWPTDSGNLYVSLAHAPGLRFRMHASDSIKSAPAFLEDKIFAASYDGYLYCLDEKKGNVRWRFTTGEPMIQSPVALGDKVFVISARGNMYAIGADTSIELWGASGIADYLAGNDKRLYCRDIRGNLAVLDAATGRRLGTVPAPHSDIPVLNTQTDRILLVSSTGLVQCLRETDLPFPVVHYMIEPQKKAAKAAPQAQGQKTDAKDQQMPDNDPFGPGGGKPAAAPAASADPFAAPAAKPAAPAAGADPFATP
jgi:outer membrane protein assembly factor BamB